MYIADKFEESKENKIEYTPVFEEYTHAIETMIDQTLKQKVPVSDHSNE